MIPSLFKENINWKNILGRMVKIWRKTLSILVIYLSILDCI